MENYKRCLAIMLQLEFVSKGSKDGLEKVRAINARLVRPFYATDDDVIYASGLLDEVLMIYRKRGKKVGKFDRQVEEFVLGEFDEFLEKQWSVVERREVCLPSQHGFKDTTMTEVDW